jgi:hypothetical protein
MQESMARAQTGIDMLNYYKNLPPEEQYKRFLLGRETPQGYEQISPAESGAKVFPYFQPKIQTSNEPPPPPQAPGTGGQPTEKTDTKKTEEKAPSEEIDPNNPPKDTTSTAPTRPYLSASTESGPIPTTSTSDGVERQSAADWRAEYRAQRPEGAPQGMFLNPATGSYEPLNAPPAPGGPPPQAQPTEQPVHPITHLKTVNDQTEQQAQQAQQEAQKQQQLQAWQAQNAQPVADSGSALEWAKRFHTGYKTATYLPHAGPGGEPAYNFSDGKSSNMVPISQMVKNGFGPSVVAQSTSSVLGMADQIQQAQQGATGPGLPFGPVSPAQQPPQPQVAQQAGQPPQQGLVWNPQQPTQGPTAPPAPVSPAQQQQLNQPPQQVAQAGQNGQVWSPQQPAPGQTASPPPAPGATSLGPSAPPATEQPDVYQPQDYRTDVAAGIPPSQYGQVIMPRGGASTLTVEAGQQAGTRTDIAAQPVAPAKAERIPLTDNDKTVFTDQAIAEARAKAANAQGDKSRADGLGNPYMFDLGPYHVYRDDTGRTGELYAVRPGRSSLFRQQQYRLGSDGWDEYDLPDTNARMQLEGLFAGGKGSINGAVIPPGTDAPAGSKFPTLTHDQIVDLPIDKVTRLLTLAGRYLNTTSQPNSPEAQRMDNFIASSQYLQRMADGAEVADKENISPSFYSTEAQYESHQARKRDATVPPGGWTTGALEPIPDLSKLPKLLSEIPNNLFWDYHNYRAHFSDRNKFSDYMEYQARGLNDAITQLQATGRVPYLQKPEEGSSVSVYGPGFGGSLKTGSDPYATTRSPHTQVMNLFSGGEPATDSKTNLLALKGAYDKQFKQEYEQAVASGWRPTAQAIDAYHRLTKGASVQDEPGIKGNAFKNEAGQLVNPYQIKSAQASAAPGPTTAPTPIPNLPIVGSRAQMDLFRKQHPNEDFQYKDEGGVWHRKTAAAMGG